MDRGNRIYTLAWERIIHAKVEKRYVVGSEQSIIDVFQSLSKDKELRFSLTDWALGNREEAFWLPNNLRYDNG